MNIKIKNNSNIDMQQMEPLLKSFLPFAKERMGFSRPVSVNFASDSENASKPLGKTAFYDPDGHSITIFVDKRHPKDILRSLSHELVHHTQNCCGKFDSIGALSTEPGYAQTNPQLRDMEKDAFLNGNICFRDWEDTHKKQLQESIYYNKGDNSKMSYKNWRDQEVNSRLMESWGYKASKSEILTESAEIEESEEIEEGGLAKRAGDPRGEKDAARSANTLREEDVVDEAEELEEMVSDPYAGMTPAMKSVMKDIAREEFEAWYAEMSAAGEAPGGDLPAGMVDPGARTGKLSPERGVTGRRVGHTGRGTYAGIGEAKIRGAVREALNKVFKNKSNKS